MHYLILFYHNCLKSPVTDQSTANTQPSHGQGWLGTIFPHTVSSTLFEHPESTNPVVLLIMLQDSCLVALACELKVRLESPSHCQRNNFATDVSLRARRLPIGVLVIVEICSQTGHKLGMSPCPTCCYYLHQSQSPGQHSRKSQQCEETWLWLILLVTLLMWQLLQIIDAS